MWEYRDAVIFLEKDDFFLAAVEVVATEVVATACHLLPGAFPLRWPSICTQVDLMHEESFFVTSDSSIVLTWNIALTCQGTDKD